MSRRGRSAKGGGKGQKAAAAAAAPPFVFDYTEARVLFNTEKYDECMALCRKGVVSGDAKAQALLADCYLSGGGVDKDSAGCVRLARQAAAQGDPEGQRVLGICHQNGYGDLRDSDSKLAANFFRKSASQGW